MLNIVIFYPILAFIGGWFGRQVLNPGKMHDFDCVSSPYLEVTNIVPGAQSRMIIPMLTMQNLIHFLTPHIIEQNERSRVSDYAVNSVESIKYVIKGTS